MNTYLNTNSVKINMSKLLLLCLGCGFISVHCTIVPDGDYRIQNYYQGSGKSLSSSSNNLIMAPTDNADQAQIWTVKNHPVKTNVIKIKSSKKQFLSMPPNRDPSLRLKEELGSDFAEFFKLVPSGDTPRIWRLVSSADPVKCVGVRTMSQRELQSLPSRDYSGNYWMFEEVQKEGEEHVTSSSSGTTVTMTTAKPTTTGETTLTTATNGSTTLDSTPILFQTTIGDNSSESAATTEFATITADTTDDALLTTTSSSDNQTENSGNSSTDSAFTTVSVTEVPLTNITDSTTPILSINETTTSGSERNVSVPEGTYRIRNLFQGTDRSLTASVRTPFMAQTVTGESDQLWKVTNHPSMLNVIKLTSFENSALSVHYGGQPSFSDSDGYEVWFQLVPYPDEPEIWRLDSLGAPGRCLGVQTKFQSQLQSLVKQDYSSNYWTFEEVDEIATSMTTSSPTTGDPKSVKKMDNSSLPDGQYRIYNYFQGMSRSMSSGSDSLKMSPAHDDQSDQIWTLKNHPSNPDVIKLTSSGGKLLALAKSGKPKLAAATSGEDDDDDVWFKLVVSSDTPNIWRLDSMVNPETCIGVITMTQSKLDPSPNSDLAGHYWIFKNVVET